MNIDLFLPMYNEEKIVEKHITIIHTFVKKHFPKDKVTLVPVDDNSQDTTLEKLLKLKKKIPMKIAHFSTGPSRRENLAVAMKDSTADIIAFIDFDLATDIRYLPQLIQEVKNGADVATGSRYIGKKRLKREWHRLLVSKLYNWIHFLYFGSKIKDHQCGFKAFKNNAYQFLAKKTRYDKKYIRGWFWDVETLVRAQKANMKVKEFPVDWIAGADTSWSYKREIKLVPYMIGLRFRL